MSALIAVWCKLADEQAEKRAQQPRYRYVSPGLDGDESNTKKRKAAEDFL
jgi:hypothetical protein